MDEFEAFFEKWFEAFLQSTQSVIGDWRQAERSTRRGFADAYRFKRRVDSEHDRVILVAKAAFQVPRRNCRRCRRQGRTAETPITAAASAVERSTDFVPFSPCQELVHAPSTGLALDTVDIAEIVGVSNDAVEVWLSAPDSGSNHGRGESDAWPRPHLDGVQDRRRRVIRAGRLRRLVATTVVLIPLLAIFGIEILIRLG